MFKLKLAEKDIFLFPENNQIIFMEIVIFF